MGKTPQLRLLITDRCIFSCQWCRQGGEGGSIEYVKPSFELKVEQIIKMISLLVNEGISYIKISGGEPLLRRDIIDIIKEVKLINGVKNIELVTMSPKLKDLGNSLCSVGLDGLTVSLNTLNEERFKQSTGCKQLDGLEDIIEGTKIIHKKGVPVKINMIPQRNFNNDEIIEMAQFAGENGLSLKFIDLMTMNVSWWRERFMPLSEVEKILQPMIKDIDEPTFQPGGLGTPMKRYLLKNGVAVFLRDATIGTHYGEICKTCKNFPCQDGLMALRLTCDGKLKYCLYRNDNLVDLFSVVGVSGGIEKTIREVIDVFRNSEFKKAWSPEIELQRIAQKEI